MITNLLYKLWAKTNERDAANEPWTRHPLPCHLLDVGLVAEAWLDADEHLFERFSALWPDLRDRDALRRVILFAAAAHDLGKADARFQAKSPEGWARGYGDAEFGPPPGHAGFDHGRATAALFEAFVDRPERWGTPWATEGWIPLMRVVGSHHGTLYRSAPATDARNGAMPATRPDADSARAAVRLLARTFGPLPDDVPDEPPPPFLMLLAGFVSVADWFGSDSAFFPFRPDVSSDAAFDAYAAEMRGLGRDAGRGPRAALHASGVLGQASRTPRTFADLFGFEPRPGFQEAAARVAFGDAPGAEIAVVEAPMGLGKTEVALALADRALRAGTASGVYLALPTQASANALFRRVRAFADTTRPPEADLALVLAHGARRFHRDYRQLLAATGRAHRAAAVGSRTDECSDAAEVTAPAWMQSSKRSLLAPVGLGTVDQAMLAAMSVRHGFVRLFGLARKVVVLDEIHGYDAYMRVILDHLLAWLGALGCKTILLSATLPQGGRRALIEAFGATPPDEGAPEAVPYPQLVWAAPGRAAVTVARDVGDAFRRTLAVEPVEPGAHADATAAGVAWVVREVEKGGCVAWIRNTVREAQEAHAALAAAGVEASLLHARFTRFDRGAKEEALLDAYGPPDDATTAARPRSGVVVATQVIEQSVDVDFDAMLSDLAPVDLLLQRAGRLWRHTKRPGDARGDRTRATLGVLLPSADDRAALRFGLSRYIYDAETLARSAVLVRAAEADGWRLPDACRTAVAALYDHDDDPDDAPGAWTDARLGLPPGTLGRLRDTASPRALRDRTRGLQTLASGPDTDVPRYHDTQRDGSDDAGVALVTRLGGRSLTLALLAPTRRGPAFLGTRRLARLPAADSVRARLKTDEAIALASVSMPWYREALAAPPLPEPAAALVAVWKERHRYDDRVFVCLDSHADGTFTAEADSYSVRYSPATGLVVTPRAAPPDAAPFQDL